MGILDALLRPICPKFEVPRPALGDWADEYISQLNAVRMVPKVSSDGRRYYTLFNLRTSDHLFDCEKMAMTLAIRRGVVPLGGPCQRKRNEIVLRYGNDKNAEA